MRATINFSRAKYCAKFLQVFKKVKIKRSTGFMVTNKE